MKRRARGAAGPAGWAWLVLMAAGCAAGPAPDGGGGAPGQGGGGGSSGADGAAVMNDGTLSDRSCLQVRSCAAACAPNDDACVQRCVDTGSAAARPLFEKLRACARTACPDQQDRTCRCESECIFPGSCADLQDQCADGLTDPACELCA